MKTVTYIKIGVAIAVVLMVMAGILWLRSATEGDHVDFGTEAG